MTGAVGVPEGKAIGLSARDPLDLGAHVQEDASSASLVSVTKLTFSREIGHFQLF